MGTDVEFVTKILLYDFVIIIEDGIGDKDGSIQEKERRNTNGHC